MGTVKVSLRTKNVLFGIIAAITASVGVAVGHKTEDVKRCETLAVDPMALTLGVKNLPPDSTNRFE
jgi:hypothetical protein